MPFLQLLRPGYTSNAALERDGFLPLSLELVKPVLLTATSLHYLLLNQTLRSHAFTLAARETGNMNLLISLRRQNPHVGNYQIIKKASKMLYSHKL